MKNILVLQHEAHEGLGAWEPIFHKPVLNVITKKIFAGDQVPLDEALCEYWGIVILGGSMSANDPLPFIQDELKMVTQAIQLKLPILGVCLGSQLIAKALGAKVYKMSGVGAPLGAPANIGAASSTPTGNIKEIGWYPIHLGISASKDEVFGGLSGPMMMFQWHGETFALPSGSIHLAKSELCANQAFKYTDRVYGLQFHCEMTDPMILNWVDKGREEIVQAGLSAELIIEKAPKYLPTLRHWATQIANKWLSVR